MSRGPVRGYRDLLERAKAYQESRALLAAVELDLFDPLLGGGATAREVAEARGLDPRATLVLLEALCALGLVEREGERFRAAPLAARYLASSSPAARRSPLLHHARLWDRWHRLPEVLRSGEPAPRTGDPDRTHEHYLRAMDEARSASPGELRRLFPFELSGLRRAIDLGGGTGSLAVALARAAPGVQVVLFDRPATLEVAARLVPPELWGSRVLPRAGDLLDEAPYGEPGSFDLAVLSAVLHGYGPRDAARMLARAAALLAPGGLLLVRELLLDDDRSGPLEAALFGLHLLVATPAGRVHTFAELSRWMRDAGLVDVRRFPADKGYAVLGRRPA